MKPPKVLFILIIGLLFIACDKSLDSITDFVDTKNDVTFINTKSDLNTQDFFVSSEDAKKLAAIINIEDEIISCEAVKVKEDTLIWLINYSKGWIAISADKRAQPILGQDKETKLSLTQDLNGPVVWLLSLAEEIKAMRESGEISENNYTLFWDSITGHKYKTKDSSIPTKSLDDYRWAIFWDGSYSYTLVTNQINHLITTKWGQRYPWNQELPTHNGTRCPTGCVAVAEGQIIYYYNDFFNLNLGLYHTVGCTASTISSETNDIGFYRSNYQSNSSRWTQMSVDSTDVTTRHPEYVGDLMLDIGNRVNTYYKANGGNVYSINLSLLPDCLNDYQLNCDDSSYVSVYPAISNLENSLPMMIRANSDVSQETHIWIIDGLREETMYIVNQYHLEYTDDYEDAIAYYSDKDISEIFGEYYSDGMEWEETSIDGVFKYFYMNWGYNGRYDTGKYSIVTNSSWRNYVNNKVLYFNFEEL